MLKQKKVIVGVLSGKKLHERRGACRDTWCRDLNSNNIEYYFLIGDPELDVQFKVDGDILYLRCPDEYKSLPQKTHLFCKWAIENKQFEYLLKCDDDSFIYVDNLLQYSTSEDYVGTWSAGKYFSGAGYLLSTKAARIIATSLLDKEGAEDKLVGQYLDEVEDVSWRKETRIKGWGNNLIMNGTQIEDPETIIDHYNRKDLMHRKYNIIQNIEFSQKKYDEVVIESLRKYFTLPQPSKGQYLRLIFTNNQKNIKGSKDSAPEKNIICITNVDVNRSNSTLIESIHANNHEMTGFPQECLNLNLKTQWHTKFKNKEVRSFPHILTIHLKDMIMINDISLITRQTSPKNGQPHDITLQISDNREFAECEIYYLRVNIINN